ncbi:PhaM family polyhydroxyalkanoate granule multifunctional regulatory protein [Allopusillimonas ginsengisoli]|uniref:PhaM family polyhydroxyalkanoate granule multifunctional regulatory protein n=1 Tax=Allopusillimonas ginsengisoli TaxID=453575 RepID=UPI0010205150|nr:PhaM family polyhydroxyalkanoate granule multifunctional regulatory protein [Allopusillimonas ginsengisoli]TEA76907.1 transcriptional regulator [Allopusillimonas ginsengisoli]
MSTQQPNPFILPGLGQAGDMASNPLLASMEMMRQAWQGLANSGGLDNSMAAPMSVDELERRINDLRAVENWLRMNLSMLSSTIQGMEVQRSTISTLQSFMAGAAAAKPDAGTTPFDAFWRLWQANPGAAAQASADDAPGRAGAEAADPAPESAGQAGQSKAKQDKSPESASDAAAQISPALAAQAMAASKGWWDMVQTQFDNLATATTASLQNAQAVQPGVKAESSSTLGKSSRKSATVKPAARKTAGAKSTGGAAPARKVSANRGSVRSKAKPVAKRSTRKPASEP